MSITRGREKRGRDTRVKYPHSRSFATAHRWEFDGRMEFDAMPARLYIRSLFARKLRRLREDRDE